MRPHLIIYFILTLLSYCKIISRLAITFPVALAQTQKYQQPLIYKEAK